ncbi:MAG: AAA family ATPase [Muribaculaceae bacterium]|nr:AAA family ATPase [Muribaculaceae bacterium]
MEQLIGRTAEKEELLRCYNSPRCEFAVIYGRRRIGKTFLVERVFENKLTFVFTGSHKSPKSRQLELFAKAISRYGKVPYELSLDNWYHAFDALETMLEATTQRGKKVLFIDEMPWIDSHNSEFVAALEDFWNSWAARRDDIMLIATGSATSWMVNNLVNNQGGLHNRITASIYLRPFNLGECESYLRHHGCVWDRYTITQCYMSLGGVPYYYSLLDYNDDLASNLDNLFFKPKAKLMNEFNELYNELFTGAQRYVEIVSLLANCHDGLTRAEIAEKIGDGGGGLTRRLTNLENCDIILPYTRYGNRKKGAIYRLTDFFSLFYLRFIADAPKGQVRYWQRRIASPAVQVWQGLTFEVICHLHVEQIRKSLGISGINTSVSTWRGTDTGSAKKVQIDLVIDRDDRYIHLCEMKFVNEPYVITREYEARLRERMAIFREQTHTTRTLFTTFVTTFGVKANLHSGIVNQQVLLDALFWKE